MELREFLLPHLGRSHVSVDEIGYDLSRVRGAQAWGVEILIRVEKGSHSCRTSGLSRAQEDSELRSHCPTETPSG